MSIKVESLTKVYDTQRAVDQISFTINKGEIVGFLGPNGAGKSTTMKIITTFIPATSGSAVVCGYDVLRFPMEVRRRVGYLPESNPLYYDMYVREYLEFSAGIHQLGKQTRKRVAEMIQLTGLGREAHKKIGMLSKGYKQRVGLAQALIHDPEVLVLDEPTSGLDPNQIVEIRELIRSLAGQKTVLLSTHIMQEVQAMCSRVIIINNGKLVADDSLEHLKGVHSRGDLLVVTFEKAVAPEHFADLAGLSTQELVSENTWRLGSPDPEALRKSVLQWAVQHDLNILAMNAQSQSLEDVFRSLTMPAMAAEPVQN